MAVFSIFDTKIGHMPEGYEELTVQGVIPAFIRVLELIKDTKDSGDMVLTRSVEDGNITTTLKTADKIYAVVLTESSRTIHGSIYVPKTMTYQNLKYTEIEGATALWSCLITAFCAQSEENSDDFANVLEAMGLYDDDNDNESLKDETSDKITKFFTRIQGAAIGHTLFKDGVSTFGTLTSLSGAQKEALFERAVAGKKDRPDRKSDYNLAAMCGFVFTEEEKAKIPEKEDWFVMPDEGYEIMDEIINSDNLRNYWLIGKAGTGKTELAKQIAANLGVPYVFVNCGSGFDDAKIRGQFIPNPDVDESEDSELISYVNSLTDSDFVLDADTIAKKIGAKSDNLSDLISRIVEIKEQKAANRPEFLWQDSPIVYAYSRPCVCEVQEADCIRDPGVLTNFNSILECGDDKFIQLDNGKIIRKNPYCIYIFTSNMQYEGCRMINNAVFDRLDPYRLELPSKRIRATRVMKRTGFKDRAVMSRMVDIVDKIDKYMTENGLNTGVCGMRSLEHWAEALMIWQKRHPGEEIPEPVLESTGARKVLAKTAQPEDELDDIKKVWYGLFGHED